MNGYYKGIGRYIQHDSYSYQKVTAKYLGHRQYEVTVSEILVTKKEKGKVEEKTVRNTKTVFSKPTILSSLFAGEALDESYRKRIFEIEEQFKLYDFDQIDYFDISKALEEEAKNVDRFLPPLYMF